MGLWDWLSKTLSGGQDEDPASQGQRDAGAGFASQDAAVATLEPPASDPAATTDNLAESESADVLTRRWWAPEPDSWDEPDESTPPELCVEARALENTLVSHFDGHNLTLPPLPRVAERVLRRLRSRNCDLTKVANDIAEDQVMAAEVLRMTNSPMYRGTHKITGLQPALARLGTKAIRTLMMHQSLRAATVHLKGVDPQLAAMVWYRSLAGGYVMRQLAGFAELNEEDAFMIGLLHDIGNVIVLRFTDEQKKVTGYEIDIDTFEYLCLETHQEFGELIANTWSLPETLRALIANHHGYPAPDDEFLTERLLLIAADTVNRMLGYGPPLSCSLLESRAIRDLGLSENTKFEAFLAALPGDLEEALMSFGTLPGLRPTPKRGGEDSRPLAEWLAEVRHGRTHDGRSLGRRRHPRWVMSNEEVVVWLDGTRYPSSVRIHDLSEGGVSLRFPEPLEAGQRVRIGHGSDDATIDGHVVNVTTEPDEDGQYRIGVEFAVSAPDDGDRTEAPSA